MKNAKRFLAMILVLVLCFAMVGCAAKDTTIADTNDQAADAKDVATDNAASNTPAADEGIKIGFLAMNRTMTWMQYALKGAEETANKLGVELVIFDAENDVAKQTSMMEDLVSLGVDAIITDPINVESLAPAVQAAYDNNVPTFTFDRRCEGAPYLGFVGCDDVLGGKLAAQYIGEKLGGKGKVVEIVGQEGSSVTYDRQKGFHSELETNYPDIEIVYSQTGEFTSEKGMSVMEDAIVAVDEFDAVFSHNDDMLIGAMQAMKDAGVDLNKVVTISYDGTPAALELIKAGDHDATIQYPSCQAGMAVESAVEYVKTGKEPAKKDVLVNPFVITIDNLKDGDFSSELD